MSPGAGRPALALAAAIAVSAAACGGGLGSEAEHAQSASDEPLQVTRLGQANPSDTSEQSQSDVGDPDDPAKRPRRPRIVPSAFRLADLPVALIPRPLDASHAPPQLPGAGGPLETDELEISRHDDGSATLKLRLPEHAFGRIKIAGTESTSPEGLRLKCGVIRHTAVPVRWETLQRDGEGRGLYTVVNAWLDVGACKHSVVDRASVPLTPILGSLLYAFRECRWVCDQGQVVTVLGPALTDLSAEGGERDQVSIPFGRIAIELQPGVGTSMTARLDPRSLDTWLGPRRPSWASDPGGVTVGVDIAQSVEDQEPVAVAYLATARPPR